MTKISGRWRNFEVEMEQQDKLLFFDGELVESFVCACGNDVIWATHEPWVTAYLVEKECTAESPEQALQEAHKLWKLNGCTVPLTILTPERLASLCAMGTNMEQDDDEIPF